MRKTITILATALLASTLAIAQADARGGGGGRDGGGTVASAEVPTWGGFGGGAHLGGFGGGEHIGGIGRVGGVGRFDGSRLAFGEGARTGGIHQHAMHRFSHPYYGYGVDCYDWYLSHPADSVSPYSYCG